jgi:hypothetical protein
MNIGIWIWGAQAAFSGGSLAAGRPWTSLASGRRYPPHVRVHPLYIAANRRITAAWTAYFALAAVVTAVTSPWVSIAFIAPTPLLGWLSFIAGDRYAAARLASASDSNEGIVMSSDRQDALRALIDGKTDDEILQAVRDAGGYEAFLEETMAGMVDAFDPDAAEDCVIGYEIVAPDGTYAYRVEVRGTEVTTQRGDAEDARVVLGLALPDYLRLINGLLDGTQAFMDGRLKLRGDVMFAPQIARIFRTA